MADEVSVRLRVLDRLRFSREMESAEDSVEEFGRAAKNTHE